MEQIPSLPTTRRLVTGHGKEGKAIFEFDDMLTPINPFPKPEREGKTDHTVEAAASPLGVTLIQGSTEELTPDNLRRGQGEPGIVCQIVDLPARSKDTPLFLRRNQSLDYGVVLKGTMQIVLDDGAERTLNEGDVYVQKGTLHAWKNISSEYSRFLTVVIPSEKVKVEATGELLEVTKIPALSD
ncbi:uncharacterized protein A1O5_08629 [Cladophialophora psammophila CBS 110553]|uniref:Cupin type-2 domain-containing protein n=1 Tax=Cladophialophora psammophila CBS 110553 TaxID=1182543 RepID=W9XC57_9EURO|nr:uncharacterized protein A1O5_08629 [Cladophialophora psammophila CBS 110553]EXJ68014.1 hypothetical protein A1O5_08629 [Cladophialophora psammophila CBS 110553]